VGSEKDISKSEYVVNADPSIATYKRIRGLPAAESVQTLVRF
jgi:hypothetical protein